MTRFARLGLFVAVLGLVGSAHAGIVTCTRSPVIDEGLTSVRLSAGSCTMSTSYATNGDTFSTNNTLADVGAVLCGSPQRNPVVVVTEGNKAGHLISYDHTARKLVAFFPTQQTGGAGNRAGIEVTAATNLSAAGVTVRFLAFCQ